MLLLHHWDADGICSASVIIKELGKDIENMVPSIGCYFLGEADRERCLGYNRICIADISLPSNDLLYLSRGAKVVVFDHHFCVPVKGIKYINPVIKGRRQGDYPSTTWVLKEHFNREADLLTILGVVGDNEKRIRENDRFSKIIEKFCMKEKLRFEDLLRAVHLIGSNYKLNLRKEVEKLPWIIKDMGIEEILEQPAWNRNVEFLEKEIERILNNDRIRTEKGNTLLVEMESPYNIISTITRRIAWDAGRDTIVINRGMKDFDQIYVRSKKVDLTKLIHLLREKEIRAGGKKDVVGAVVEKERSRDVLSLIVNFMEGRTW